MTLSVKLLRSAYFLAIICATVLATEAYFDFKHGKLHGASYEALAPAR